MGMTCQLSRVHPAEIDRLLSDSEALAVFLYGERPSKPVQRGLLGFLKRLSPITIETTSPEDLASAPLPDPAIHLDLDKAWQGLHFLFTGTALEGEEPGCYLVRGGEDMGEDEIGNDIPRLLRPAQVRRFHEFVADLTDDELRRRFDPARMTTLEIYPERLWNESRAGPAERESALEYLLVSGRVLREFLHRAAEAGDGVIVHIS